MLKVLKTETKFCANIFFCIIRKKLFDLRKKNSITLGWKRRIKYSILFVSMNNGNLLLGQIYFLL